MQLTIIVGFYKLILIGLARNKGRTSLGTNTFSTWIDITLLTKFLTLVWWLGSAPAASNLLEILQYTLILNKQ